MQRIWAIGAIALACAIAPGVAAQQVDQGEIPACPSASMSVYFASGESVVSAAGRELVTRLVDHAVACQPDAIDLLTRISTEVDGDGALALALARIEDIAADLIARGVSPETIRVAALPGRDVFPPGMSRVEVIFRKSASGAGAAVTRQPATPRPASPGSI